MEESHGTSDALVQQILEIQKCKMMHERSEEWASHLRFVCVPKLTSYWTLRLTHRWEDPNERNNVAIPYCWRSAEEAVTPRGDGSRYSILTPSGERLCRAPHTIWSALYATPGTLRSDVSGSIRNASIKTAQKIKRQESNLGPRFPGVR